MIRGQSIYYNDGELAFDIAINTKKHVGTHKGIYLEPCEYPDACGNTYSKILTENDKITVISDKLISLFNI
jgi:hypothetical protein